MKKILSIFTIAALLLVLAACNNRPVGVGNSGILSADTAGLAEFQAWKMQQENALKYSYAKKSNVATKRNQSTTYRTESRTTESSNAAKPVAKKGWSKAAKGVAIGGASGAVIGAVVHKRNRVVGGVVGGVVGAGVGYGIGRSMDRKDGRVTK